MHNVEFKAELRDLPLARTQCGIVGASHIGTLDQTDTYFRMPDGRLKRREAKGEPTEWIFYHRDDNVRPRISNYTILSDDQARRRWGTMNLRQWVVVRKVRELWMLDNCRIHLDDVESLGRFIEFEAVVSEKYNVRECHAIVAHMRDVFTPVIGEPIRVSYSDMVGAAHSAGSDS